MSVINDFIAYSYVVDGDKKSCDRVYSIVDRFHRNESQTLLFQNEAKDKPCVFAVQSEHDPDQYDEDIGLPNQAILDVIKLQALMRNHNENLPPLEIYGVSVQNVFDLTILFSIKYTGGTRKDTILATSTYDIGEYHEYLLDENPDLPDFHDYSSPEDIKKILFFLTSQDGIDTIRSILDEMDDAQPLGDHILERFADEKEPFTNKTIPEYMQGFAKKIPSYDDLF